MENQEQTTEQMNFVFNEYIVLQIYQHLLSLAWQSRTTTYEEIALQFGLPSKGNQLGQTLSPILGRIFSFCESKKQPYLTSLVVRKSGPDKGIPGAGFWELFGVMYSDTPRSMKREITENMQESVFSYWKAL